MRTSVWQIVALLPFVVAAQDVLPKTTPAASSVASSSSSSLSSASANLSATPGPSDISKSAPALSATPTGNSTASATATGNSTASAPDVSATGATTNSTGFKPFPVPADIPEPPAYIATDPLQPPQVGSSAVPDFGPAWTTAWKKAKAKVSGFTLEEKVNVTTGVGWAIGRCVGNIGGIEPINGRGWPGFCLEDSPLGVRFGDYVTAFPTGVNTAASFNRNLIRLRGLYMGKEHVGKGVNVALGPMMNMGRVAQGGRNWEGFGADPYLTGEAAYETILGMQQGGVIGCAKHLVGNEQEYKRTESSSEIDDRTMHEIYAHPFLKSVIAGVGSMMCSYNLVNGTYACENDKVMNDIVKREFGFQGFIMSDWSAQHSTLSAVTGLDMTMPGDITFDSGDSYFGGNLTAYVKNGTIPEGRVDDMATRILASWYLLHQDSPSFPPTNFNAFHPDDDATNSRIDVQDDHYKLVRQLGAASTVLLKNTNGALPLGQRGKYGNDPKGRPQAERDIVLIGSGAGPGHAGPNEFSDQGGVISGALAMGWGSGTANFTYLVNPLQAIQAKAREYRTSVSWLLDDYDLPRAGNMAVKKSAALVFLKADSGEEYIHVDGNNGDRKNLTAWGDGDNLVLSVAAQNNNTIVIVNSVGPLIVEPWIDHPNVTAVVWAGLPGQESGDSLTDVLYGAWNPTGRLPYTIAKKPEDYSAQLTFGDAEIITIPYSEGLLIDYRHFDANNIKPRFEFGFGLSYTKFTYSGLRVDKIAFAGQEVPAEAKLAQAWEKGGASPVAEGSSRAFWLHRPVYKVSFWIQNTGKVFGGETPQLYLNFPAASGEPPSVLRGFTNTELAPGEKKVVSFTLSRYDLSIWDVAKQGWRKPDGQIGVTVGASSRDGRVKGVVTI